MIARCRLPADRGRADPRRPGRDPQRLAHLTRTATHVWRLLKWGRALARHGALRGIERDPTTPDQVRRLARLARFGLPMPATPDYAAALQEIGPPAIKLGQTLVDPPRPGRRACRRQPVAAPGRPAALALPADQGGDRNLVRSAARAALRLVRPGADRRRVDRPGPPRGDHRRPRRRGQGAPPGRRAGVRPRHRDLRMGGGADRERRRRGRAAAPAPGRRPFQAMDRARARPSARGGLRVRAEGEYDRRAGLLRARDRLEPDRAAGADAGMARRASSSTTAKR